MARGLVVNAIGEVTPAVTGLTTFQIWTLAVAAVAAVGIGTIAAALISARATQRRESGAWLKQMQIDANKQFNNCASKLRAHAVERHRIQVLRDMQPDEIASASEKVADCRDDITKKFEQLLLVGQPRTVDIARDVLECLPGLAYQAIPLSRTLHPAALQQRQAAVNAIDELMICLRMVMRRDVGLSGWREYRGVRKYWKNASFHQQVLSLVDRQEVRRRWRRAKVKAVSAAELGEVLRSWEVRTIEGGILPESPPGYQVDTIPPDYSGGRTLQAVAVKTPGVYWRFGILRELPIDTERKILQDAIRLITGHLFAFRLQQTDIWWKEDDDSRVTVWENVK